VKGFIFHTFPVTDLSRSEVSVETWEALHPLKIEEILTFRWETLFVLDCFVIHWYIYSC